MRANSYIPHDGANAAISPKEKLIALATTEAPTTVKDTGKPARPATDPAGPTGRLATWVAQTRSTTFPPPSATAKHLVLDGIACALVGAQLPVSRIGAEGVTALDSAGDTPLVGWDGRATSATSAAMLNSSFIQGRARRLHPLAPLHSNALIRPAMLAAAPHVGSVSGERFLLGAIVRAISAERQAAIEKAVLDIDTLDDIAQLTALLTPAALTARLSPSDRMRYPRPPMASSSAPVAHKTGSKMPTTLDPATALVLIGLQHGITALPTRTPPKTSLLGASHLRHVFEKLGIKSRLALGPLAEHRPEPRRG